MRSPAARLGALSALVASLVSSSAFAQQTSGLALDTFEPSAAGDAFAGVPSPFARGHLILRGVVDFDYAHQPLRLSQGGTNSSVVGSQAFLHIGASFAVLDRLLISANMPVAVLQGGDNPTIKGTATNASGGVTSSPKVASPSSAQAGDLRVGARVRIVGEDDEPFQLGAGLDFHVPTAPKGSFAGEGSLREAPYAAIGGRFKARVPFVWTASLGGLIRSSDNPSTLTYGAGFAVVLLGDRLQIGPEYHGQTPLQSGTLTLSNGVTVPAKESTTAEVLLGVKARLVAGLFVGAAGGPGLTSAIGTPAFRAIGQLGWSPEPRREADGPKDTDGDGILDAVDACPYAFGPANADPKRNGCPDLDDDQDGIPNHLDACPQVYGAANADPAKNGCPAHSAPPPPPPPPR